MIRVNGRISLSLLPLRVRWLSRWDAGLRVRAQGTSEQQDVRFGPVDLVVDPSARLLHAKITPLLLGQDTRRVQRLRHLLGQNHVPSGS